jgi:hypothetical protein
MAAMMDGRQGHRTSLLKGTPKDDSGQVWFKLSQWFQRRRFLKKLVIALFSSHFKIFNTFRLIFQKL